MVLGIASFAQSTTVTDSPTETDKAPACPDGEEKCGDSCTDLLSDPDNCGECSKKCPDKTACVKGACIMGCPEGKTDCDGRCADLASDPKNCGACKNVTDDMVA
jgi:hypothetical protein